MNQRIGFLSTRHSISICTFHFARAAIDAVVSKSLEGELDALLGAVAGLENVSYSSLNLGCFSKADFSSLISNLAYLPSW